MIRVGEGQMMVRGRQVNIKSQKFSELDIGGCVKFDKFHLM